MNFLIFNRSAENLKTAIYGHHNDNVLPIATDAQGNFIFSPTSQVTVTATNLDIRDLTSARDTVVVTAINFDIRNLTGTQDSVRISSKGFVEAQTTLNVPSSTTMVLLEREIGPYSQNSYFVRNTDGLLGGSITVMIEIAPIPGNDDYYYQISSASVGTSSNYLVAIGTLMRYARMRVQTGGQSVGINAYYNGRA